MIIIFRMYIEVCQGKSASLASWYSSWLKEEWHLPPQAWGHKGANLNDGDDKDDRSGFKKSIDGITNQTGRRRFKWSLDHVGLSGNRVPKKKHGWS